ncbi:MAG: hypothetical protein ACR2IL_10760 [Chitinophagaceae bacterium]
MEGQNIKIELTVAQWNVVMAALGELPLKNSVEVFSAIRAQADAALKPAEAPAE